MRDAPRKRKVFAPTIPYTPPPFRQSAPRSIDTARQAQTVSAPTVPVAARPTMIVPKPLEIGASLTGNAYIGDYTQRGYAFTRFHSGGNFSLQLVNERRTQFQFNTGFGKIAGEYDDYVPRLDNTAKLPNGFQRVTFFQTSYFYGDARLRFRLLRQYPDFPRLWEPYVSAGAGFMIFSPRDKVGKFLSESAKTRPVGEKYSTFAGQFPLSVGTKFHLSKQVALGVEYTYRFVTTDFLDNMSRLGTKKGNDQLHTLSGTVYVRIQAPTIYIDTCGVDENMQWWQLQPQMSFSASLDSALAVAEIYPMLLQPDAALDTLNLRLRMGYYEPVRPIDSRQQVLRRAMNMHLPPLQRMVVPPLPQLIGKIEDDNYRAEITRQAIDNGDVMYYHVKSDDTLEGLSHRYWVTPDIIRELNGLPPTATRPPQGKYLTLPDLRKYYKK